MRILFVTPFYYPENKFGGPPRKIHAISRALCGLGHEVTVLTFHSELPEGAQAFTVDGVGIEYLPWLGSGLKQWPRDQRRVRAAAKSSEVVHCYGIYNLLCPLAIWSAECLGRAVVVEPLGMFPPRAGSQAAKKVFNFAITRWMLKQSRAVVAASKAERDDLCGITQAEKIVVRRNGIDIARFERLPSADAIRQRWGIVPGEKTVLFVGRLSPIKNLEQLILAFARADILGARLILVGPAEPGYEARLRALIESENLGSRVLLAGPLYDDEQKAALCAADLFVLPSLNESFGNAAAEAVAAGVPVLLTETCGIAPMIHERAGMAVPLGVDSLAEGIRKMLDPEFRDLITSRRDEVKRELSWEEPIKETIALYERIVAENAETLKSIEKVN